jgi:hypothetical protein
MAYKDFIPENVAPIGARRIGIYDSNGNRVGQIPLGSLTPPTIGKKRYSVGIGSDLHLPYNTGESDCEKAFKYWNEEKVDFICISGDLSDIGTDARLSRFKEMVDRHSPNTSVFVSGGNHDALNSDWNLRPEEEVSASLLTWTGHPLYHSFEYGDDVYIFVGICQDTFSVAELQWLYETLERYRNRRCFLFEHSYASESSGNAFGLYTYDLLNTPRGRVFKSLLWHYHNIVWFHGHTHTKFHGQEFSKRANIEKEVFGCWSVHVPSVSVPRTDADGDGNFQMEEYDSEGYICHVYDNGIWLLGVDFVTQKYIPIASYWLDTTLQIIPAGTYTDPTGTIVT